MMWFYVLASIALITVISVVIVTMRRKRLSPLRRSQLLSQWRKVATVTDPGRRVFEAEKVVDALLTELQFRGTFADKLKAAGSLLGDAEPLWKAHKVRNRLAHEAGFTVSEEESRRVVTAFERTLMRFIR
ncbi:MAG: hypothetical protein PHE68_02815 [Candidatus Peribacteraceae bacterium]|nr:hypothetical protein [Candidatus Peribacteraceae bacterium]MDD5074639.1 hypothetical protein [Candidatus Peribacteraceae bacterium]